MQIIRGAKFSRKTGHARGLLLAVSLLAASSAMAAGVTVLSAQDIRTMDPQQPRVQAMAFDDSGAIVALGDADELLRRYPDAGRIDAGEATVIPGLIDAHGHVAGLGITHMQADLVGAASKEEVVQRLRAFAADLPADAWLLGGGWDQNDWPGHAFPTAADLDAAFPDRPVWLSRVDGHAGWANSAAMAVIGRDLSGNGSQGDWHPDGGRIVRDAEGLATGIFVDGAMSLLDSKIPPMDAAAHEHALALGMRMAVEHGLTGVHDAGVSLQQMRAYQALADRGEMPLRIHAMADGDSDALAW